MRVGEGAQRVHAVGGPARARQRAGHRPRRDDEAVVGELCAVIEEHPPVVGVEADGAPGLRAIASGRGGAGSA